jgi:hypothetical protein
VHFVCALYFGRRNDGSKSIQRQRGLSAHINGDTFSIHDLSTLLKLAHPMHWGNVEALMACIMIVTPAIEGPQKILATNFAIV